MSEQDIQDWIGKQVAGNDVVLFMKGTKQMPQCGFSMQVAQILDHLGVDFKDINVLEDMSVRDGIKAYSNWPTIPQLYVKGEFIGGCDIVREMFQAGELQELLTAKGIAHNAQTLTRSLPLCPHPVAGRPECSDLILWMRQRRRSSA